MGFLGIDPNQTIFPSSEYESWGLTKREYFAVMIMQGITASGQMDSFWDSDNEYAMVSKAVAVADALIKELNDEG